MAGVDSVERLNSSSGRHRNRLVLPGGRVSLLRLIPAVDKLKKLESDEQIGVNLVKRALEEPIRLIALNAGHEGAVIVEKVRGNTSLNFGFDANAEEYGDLVQRGIIDPTKVTRCALQNASSIASLLLTTEALISEIPEEDKDKTPPMPPGGGGMY